jgi:hypothetical protein
MKILRVSNFDEDTYRPVVIDFGIPLPQRTAERICDELNAHLAERSPHYFRVVPDSDTTAEDWKDPRE